VLRPPLAPAVLFVAAWACRRNRRHWVALACGGAIPVAALGLTDAIAWGMPFHSVWRLFAANVIEGVLEEFGPPPVGWYLSKLVSDWGAAFLILLMLFLRGAPLAPLPAATAGVILVSHAMMGHQEISYIYAALPPILIVAGIGTLRVSGWLAEALKPGELDRRQIIGHATVLWALLCGMTAVGGGFRPNWTQNAGFLRAAIELRRQDDLCGLVFYGDLALWTMSGGNSYMDRDAPLYWAMDPRMLAELEGVANFALTERRLLDQMPGYTALGCTAEGTGIGEVCLARTAATRCNATTRHNLNHIPYLGRPWAVPRD
jgi:GPI mannosyltransferase 3